MLITYIEHSGFAVEWEDCIWLFDYYRGALPVWDTKKSLFIFSSHGHRDHFVPEIFDLFSGFEKVHYILSSDIQKEVKKLPLENLPHGIDYVKPGENLKLAVRENQSIQIKTLDSTDRGVAFLIDYQEQSVFHAGDLNAWVWEEDSKAEKQDMITRYQREVDKLMRIPLNIAFLPLDHRLEDNYDMGIHYFMEHVNTEYIFPMHLWGRYSTVTKFRDSLPGTAQRSKIVNVTHPGQQWEYEKAELKEITDKRRLG